MGLGIDSTMLLQMKKGQGETNQRLDEIVVELRRLNDNLRQLLATRQTA